MLSSIKKTLEETASNFNPISEKLNKERKAMINVLIAAGYSKEAIIKFIYVTESDTEKYIDKQYSKMLSTNKSA